MVPKAPSNCTTAAWEGDAHRWCGEVGAGESGGSGVATNLGGGRPDLWHYISWYHAPHHTHTKLCVWIKRAHKA
jgi:hypothetical protein